MYRDLFHHALWVKEIGEGLLPLRFTQQQLDFYSTLGEAFKNRSLCTSGISLELLTERDTVSFDYETAMFYVKTGGFDVYEDDIYVSNIPINPLEAKGRFEYRKKKAGLCKLQIYLPNSARIIINNIDFGAFIPVKNTDAARVLYYGDSLTQSAYSNTPSLSYATLYSRCLQAESINRGIGSMRFNKESLDLNDPFVPDIVFVEYGANDLVKFINNGASYYYLKHDQLDEVLDNSTAYLEKLRTLYQKAKIYLITPTWSTDYDINEERRETSAALNELLFSQAKKFGCTPIDGLKLVPHMPEFNVEDGIHHNALGSQQFAINLIAATGR